MYDQTITHFLHLFRLLANCFQWLGCVNIPDSFDLFYKDQIESWHRVLGKGTFSYITPLPPPLYCRGDKGTRGKQFKHIQIDEGVK